MKNTYEVSVPNTFTKKYEKVSVTKEVYEVYTRTDWNIKDDNERYYDHEIQFSALIGGEDGEYENFREFIDTENVSEKLMLEREKKARLYQAIEKLSQTEKEAVIAIYFEGLTEREYADLLGVCRNVIHKRKARALKKIKKNLEI